MASSEDILPNGTKVMLVMNEGNENPFSEGYRDRVEELNEMINGQPKDPRHTDEKQGTIVSYDASKKMYNVMWENAISPLPNKEGYLMYPSELTIIPPSQGGGKRARRSRKSRKSRKVRKSHKKSRKSRKARKSRRRARR